MADDTPQPAAADTPNTSDRLRAEPPAKAGATKASAGVSGLKDEARKAGDNAKSLLRDNAQKLTSQAGEKARGLAEDGKARAGTALDELARMMTEAAGSVDERLGKQYGDYARSAADAVQGFSSNLQAKEIDDLVADARSFVSKSPAVAIGTAAAVGFVLARLVMSGVDNRKA